MEEIKFPADSSEEKEISENVGQEIKDLGETDQTNKEEVETETAEARDVETLENESESREKEETYAFRWDYSQQCVNDKSRAAGKPRGREKGLLIYAIVMTVSFLLAFAILILALRFNNFSDWFMPDVEELEISDVVDIGMPSTVTIFAYESETDASSGSGFAVTETGYIITNYHVVENSVLGIEIVDSYGNYYTASVVGYDKDLDIAVLYSDQARLTPVVVGNSDLLKLGQEVVAIGSPGGSSYMFSVSDGIISKIGHAAEGNQSLLMTNAPLNPGNSGGPLFDMTGSVIGVVVAKAPSFVLDDGSQICSEGLAMIIPINDVLEYAREVITSDLETPMLGVTASGVEAGKIYYIDGDSGAVYICERINGDLYYTNEYYERQIIADDMLDDDHYVVEADHTGVLITGVTKGLGADGVMMKGDIVTKVDGKTVTTVYEVKDITKTHKVGDKIAVEFYRDGKLMHKEMTLKTKGEMLEAESN